MAVLSVFARPLREMAAAINASAAAALWAGGHQRVNRPLPCPRNAAQQHGLNAGIAEVRVIVALHPHEGTIRLSAFERPLIRPDLRDLLPLVPLRARRRRDRCRRE